MGLFPAGLLEDTIKRAFGNVQFRMAGNGHALAWFFGMNQLPVTSALANDSPSLLVQAFEEIANFHE
jgi:hypothetical protein